MHSHKMILDLLLTSYHQKKFQSQKMWLNLMQLTLTTTIGVGTTGHLYLANQTNPDAPPENVLEGFRVGARDLDTLNVLVPSASGISTEYASRIVMPNGLGFSTHKTI